MVNNCHGTERLTGGYCSRVSYFSPYESLSLTNRAAEFGGSGPDLIERKAQERTAGHLCLFVQLHFLKIFQRKTRSLLRFFDNFFQICTNSQGVVAQLGGTAREQEHSGSGKVIQKELSCPEHADQ